MFGWRAFPRAALMASLLLVPSTAAVGLVMVSDRGEWPATWPKALEPCRARAKTVEVAHGIQETVHEITFASRQEFEKAWPAVLTLLGKGAPLILESSPSTYGTSGSKAGPGVRIRCASGGKLGSKPRLGPPWPDNLRLPSGALPEYVVRVDGKWAPFDGTSRAGFAFRARQDVVLIVDGTVVDLNRIRLPSGHPVIDNRKLGATAD